MTNKIDALDAVVPTPQDTQLASEASRVLAKRPQDRFRIRLDNGQEIVLPHAAERLIAHLLTEMAQGNAVTLIPVHAELTTQEAADFLNVSRPFLVGLLEQKKIPFHMVGTHRRIRFSDLSHFKRNFEKEREEILNELSQQSQELKLGY
jgi:excisionase family DNA binding protein